MNKKSKNLYFINHKLYVGLLVVSVLIIMICIKIPYGCPWFSVGTGIGCGGVASTIVAWLIDEANLKRDMELLKENRHIILEKLDWAFSSGLQLLIVFIKPNLNTEEPKKWFEWVEIACQFAKRDDCYKEINQYIMCFINDIKEKVIEIQAQSAILLANGLLVKEDIEALSIIKTTCDISVNELNPLTNEQEFSKNIIIQCRTIKAAIGYSENLRKLNEMIIEPEIYNMLLKKKDE